jgi:uncharacterized RDD family membrane protein YckC
MQIYLHRDGQRTGPFSLEEVNRQLAAGRLNPTDLGWSESSPGWKPLLSFVGVIVPGGASSTAAPIGMATPVTFGLLRYAGFWIRAVAFAIDLIILTLLFLFVAAFCLRNYGGDSYSLRPITIQSVISFLYFALFWSSPMQATLGQKFCGLKVVDGIGARRISLMRALSRTFALVLSGLLLGIGYLMAAFTERKRALHDMVADTCVVKAT